MTFPTVAVLLSLYKGEAYLADQLESLSRQEGVKVHLIARDDGSPDNSAQLCGELCRKFSLSHEVESGPNRGAANSFLDLLFRNLEQYDFVAFCDQDDVWRDDKLIRAVRSLAPLGSDPALYCSAHVTTNECLQELATSPHPASDGFGNALIQNIVQGATAVMNRAGVELIQRVGRPEQTYMHDWWLYLVFSALGRVVYDPYPSVLYRQHEANVVGAHHSFVRHWLGRFNRHFGGSSGAFFAQAQEFDRLAGSLLTGQDRRVLALLLRSKTSLSARIRLATRGELWRQRWIDDLIFRLLLLSGRY